MAIDMSQSETANVERWGEAPTSDIKIALNAALNGKQDFLDTLRTSKYSENLFLYGTTGMAGMVAEAIKETASNIQHDKKKVAKIAEIAKDFKDYFLSKDAKAGLGLDDIIDSGVLGLQNIIPAGVIMPEPPKFADRVSGNAPKSTQPSKKWEFFDHPDLQPSVSLKVDGKVVDPATLTGRDKILYGVLDGIMKSDSVKYHASAVTPYGKESAWERIRQTCSGLLERNPDLKDKEHERDKLFSDTLGIVQELLPGVIADFGRDSVYRR